MITAKLLLAYFLKTTNIFGPDINPDTIDLEQAYCLAQNVYYESRNETMKGQFAVASVTVNRANDPRYPDTVCEVVKQKTISKFTKQVVCQFSWYCEGQKAKKAIPLTNRDGSINQEAVNQFQVASIVAISVLAGKVKDNTAGSTHFHNPFTSSPPWRHTLKKTMLIGNHAFYKLPPPTKETQ